MLNYSTSEENYIKAIFHLQEEETSVTTNELAAELQTKPASVTDMMKKLKAKKLLHYQPYRVSGLPQKEKKWPSASSVGTGSGNFSWPKN